MSSSIDNRIFLCFCGEIFKAANDETHVYESKRIGKLELKFDVLLFKLNSSTDNSLFPKSAKLNASKETIALFW